MAKRMTSPMRGLRALAALVLLAGCVGAGETPAGRPDGAGVTPSRVILYPGTLTVEMSDRSLCTGPRNSQGAAWSGSLAGCRHLWPYEVRHPAPRIPRLPLASAGPEGAAVRLTSPDGRVHGWGLPTPGRS